MSLVAYLAALRLGLLTALAFFGRGSIVHMRSLGLHGRSIPIVRVRYKLIVQEEAVVQLVGHGGGRRGQRGAWVAESARTRRARCHGLPLSAMVKRSTTSKFPIARIKRIMQADEDVGKVAQATPVVICTCND